MGGSAPGGPAGSVVDRAVNVLADAGHANASAELARVARRNDVGLDELAAAIVEVAGRRDRVAGHLADVIRLNWRGVLPDG